MGRAQAAMDLGFHISFSGIVTFKNARALKEVAQRVPLERMLIETDSPYLAPVPFRARPISRRWCDTSPRRSPGCGTVRGGVGRVTSGNFFRLFGLADRERRMRRLRGKNRDCSDCAGLCCPVAARRVRRRSAGSTRT
jgi:Tat protein secretion system quality control protein TatD with DNase activity